MMVKLHGLQVAYFLIKFITCIILMFVIDLNKKINNLYFLKCKKQILKKGVKALDRFTY